jgi:phenylpropionate dioxygenase-like ring-hydroxylating dioxygenase large terminal subunit
MHPAAGPATEGADGPAAGLPGRSYVDPEIFALERSRVFWPAWQWVGHVSDLPAPGTALRYDLMGRSAFVIRGRDGALRAFHNVCRHRGSRLIDGDRSTGLAFCVDGRVRCPNHAWVYGDDGVLLEVPREARYPGLDRATLGLHPLAVQAWMGQLFVAFEPPSRPVAEEFGEPAIELEAYRPESMRRIGEPRAWTYSANWKLICEHRLDLLHVARGHSLPGVLDNLRPVSREQMVSVSGDVGAGDAASWSSRAYARWLPDFTVLPPARRRSWSRQFLWPNVIFDVHPEQLRVTQLLPTSVGETVVRSTSFGLPDAAGGSRLARYLGDRIDRRVRAVERRLVERVQAGVASGDYATGPLAVDEPALRWFTRRWLQGVPEGAAVAGGPDASRPRSRTRRKRIFG